MSNIIKTDEDGWGCVPELKEVVRNIEECSHHTYEINNCVRVSSLEDLVYELRTNLQYAIHALDAIDVDREFETIEEEEEDMTDEEYETFYNKTRGL
tara:strand:- start:110 stop:400 length:291 start_codon:yes stop_codon:yes gene_type:complete